MLEGDDSDSELGGLEGKACGGGGAGGSSRGGDDEYWDERKRGGLESSEATIFVVVPAGLLSDFVTHFEEDVRRRASTCTVVWVTTPLEFAAGFGYALSYCILAARELGCQRFFTIDDDIQQFYMVHSQLLKIQRCSAAVGLRFAQHVYDSIRANQYCEWDNDLGDVVEDVVKKWTKLCVPKEAQRRVRRNVVDVLKGALSGKEDGKVNPRLSTWPRDVMSAATGFCSASEDQLQQLVSALEPRLLRSQKDLEDFAGVALCHKALGRENLYSRFPDRHFRLHSKRSTQVMLHNTAAVGQLLLVPDSVLLWLPTAPEVCGGDIGSGGGAGAGAGGSMYGCGLDDTSGPCAGGGSHERHTDDAPSTVTGGAGGSSSGGASGAGVADSSVDFGLLTRVEGGEDSAGFDPLSANSRKHAEWDRDDAGGAVQQYLQFRRSVMPLRQHVHADFFWCKQVRCHLVDGLYCWSWYGRSWGRSWFVCFS